MSSSRSHWNKWGQYNSLLAFEKRFILNGLVRETFFKALRKCQAQTSFQLHGSALCSGHYAEQKCHQLHNGQDVSLQQDQKETCLSLHRDTRMLQKYLFKIDIHKKPWDSCLELMQSETIVGETHSYTAEGPQIPASVCAGIPGSSDYNWNCSQGWGRESIWDTR